MKKLSFSKLEVLSMNLQLNAKQKIELKGGNTENGGRSGTVSVLDTDMESIVKE